MGSHSVNSKALTNGRDYQELLARVYSVIAREAKCLNTGGLPSGVPPATLIR